MSVLRYPKGSVNVQTGLACGREWRTSYGKRQIRSIKNSGKEEIMEKKLGTPSVGVDVA